MLLQVDRTGKDGSIYICDRCKKEIHTNTERRYRLCANIDKSLKGYSKTIRAYDLCKHCCSVVCHAIEKGVTK